MIPQNHLSSIIQSSPSHNHSTDYTLRNYCHSKKTSQLTMSPSPESIAHLDQFFQYQNRLASFLEWPLEWEIQEPVKPTPETFARAGFFYNPTPPYTTDNVICPFCTLALDMWEPDDDPMLEHKKRSSNCEFVRGHPRARNMASDLKERTEAAVACLAKEKNTSYHTKTKVKNDKEKRDQDTLKRGSERGRRGSRGRGRGRGGQRGRSVTRTT